MNQSKKVIFLYPYPEDEVASQRFRFEQYLHLLSQNNIHFHCLSFYTRWFYNILYDDKKYFLKFIGLLTGVLRRLIHLVYCISSDYVFIHRELTPIGPPIFEWLITKVLRKKVIYDFDDAIWLPNTSAENKLAASIKFHKKFNSICRWSYKISCCNDFLANYANQFNSNIQINPTTIDTSKFYPPDHSKNANWLTIGWTGTQSTVSYLESIKGSLERILNEGEKVKLLVICNKKPKWDINNYEYIKWSKESEFSDLAKIDIGLMPLPESEWAKGKCGFKILQYFSAGIPAIASNVGVNSSLIVHGKNGYLCNNERDWYNYIKALIQSKEMRKQMGLIGCDLVKNHFSLTSNTLNFLRLFE